jgi:hypothetical protein
MLEAVGPTLCRLTLCGGLADMVPGADGECAGRRRGGYGEGHGGGGGGRVAKAVGAVGAAAKAAAVKADKPFGGTRATRPDAGVHAAG